MFLDASHLTTIFSSKPVNQPDICCSNSLICINLPLLAEAITSLHRNESNAQDIVNMLARGGHINTVWPGNKPNDWTLRSTFSNITSDGMIRECIIPVLLHVRKIHY